MTELKYPTEDVYEGPFLIDIKELLELDTILEKQWQKLVDWHTQKVEEEANRRLADSSQSLRKDLDKDDVIAEIVHEYDWRRSERNVEVQFKGGKTVSATTFEELLNKPFVKDLLPISFSVILEKGPIRAEIKPSYNGVDYSVTVNSHTQVAYEVKEALGQWLADISPSWWLRLWTKITKLFPFQWALVFLFAYVFFLIWVFSDSPREIALQKYHSKLQHEAAVLLNDGRITEDEIPDAIRISLELTTDYLPTDTVIAPRRFPKAWLWAFGLSVIIALLLSFRPRFGIAIGKGAARVQAWRVYIKFVGGTLRLITLNYLILPWLGKLLWD